MKNQQTKVISLNNKYFYNINDYIAADSGETYEVLEFIGAGGNGAVYECLNRNGEIFAVKFLLRNNDISQARFLMETKLLKEISHPHIIKYIDNGMVMGYDKYRKATTDILFVVMERADRNLVDLLKNNEENLEYEEYIGQFRGLCEALSVLHHYAIHRDIKPENILIKGEKWLLSDFGLCKCFQDEEALDLTNTYEKVGPVLWMTPEAGTKYYFGHDEINCYSDVYQLSKVFLFALTKRYPGGIISDYEINTTNPIKKLLLEAISYDYHKRPTNGEIFLHRLNEAIMLYMEEA